MVDRILCTLRNLVSNEPLVLGAVLHGSRALGIFYPESDLDFVFVVADDATSEDCHDILQRAFARSDAVHAQCRRTAHTRRWIAEVVLSANGEQTEFEVCCYKMSEYVREHLHTTRTIAQWTMEERAAHVAEVRRCHRDGDLDAKRAAKKWAFYELDDVEDLSGQDHHQHDVCTCCGCPTALQWLHDEFKTRSHADDVGGSLDFPHPSMHTPPNIVDRQKGRWIDNV